jgi:hypothetical protein
MEVRLQGLVQPVMKLVDLDQVDVMYDMTIVPANGDMSPGYKERSSDWRSLPGNQKNKDEQKVTLK